MNMQHLLWLMAWQTVTGHLPRLRYFPAAQTGPLAV